MHTITAFATWSLILSLEKSTLSYASIMLSSLPVATEEISNIIIKRYLKHYLKTLIAYY